LKSSFTLIVVLLVGVWLRFDALTQDVRFHPDEALFATFARDAAVHGQWMFPGALDKPPLSLYAAALSMHGVGVTVNAKGVLDLDLRTGEFAARLPSAFAGIISMALVYILAWILSRQREAALIAALLMAMSPFHIAFSATAFTDPLMLMCALVSLVMAARGRPAWAGMWLALSVWSKQQGVFFLPLVLWLVFTQSLVGTRLTRFACTASDTFKRWFYWRTPYRESLQSGILFIRFMVAFAIGIVLLLTWDAARSPSQNATSLFTLAAVNNNPERTLIRLDELLPRFSVWGSYLATFFGTPLLTFGLTLVGVMAVPRAMWRRLSPMAGYCVLYLLAHWLIGFNLYDRYLLPLVPLLAVIVGAGLGSILDRGMIPHAPTTPNLQRRSATNEFRGRTGLNMRSMSLSRQITMVGLLAGIVLLSAYPARYPTDGRPRDNSIIELAAYLNAKSLGAILYDPWLGWELGYYLGAWSDKRRVHYPAPEILAEDALLNPDLAPRYLIAPHDRDVASWFDALENNGFNITLDWEDARYVVFELLPPESVADQAAR
jgi:hypothetical protein